MISKNMKHYDHIICGGGLVGSLWALFLKKKGYSVALFQAYFDIRKQLLSEGRSINLILSRRALQALQKVGVKQNVLQHAKIIKGRAIHKPEGEIVYLPYGANQNQVTFCIQRNKLNEILMTIAETNNVDIYFRCAFEDADFKNNIYTFTTQTQRLQFSGNHLYGADGANSKVREVIIRQTGGAQQTRWFQSQYKQLFLQSDQNGNYMLDPESIHIWPRGNCFLMGQPNLNGTFSLTLVLPTIGQINFSIKDEEKIEKFFVTNFPDVLELIPNYIYQFIQNPIGYFGTLYTKPWHYTNKAVLIGDSAHTLVPFFWQSVNCAFNDCVVLDSCIDKYGLNLGFYMYDKQQKPNGDSIAKLSIKNYQKLADPRKILEKQIQVRLCQIFPEQYCSKNRAIFFGNHNYQQIQKLAEKNDKILEQLSRGIKSAEQLNIDLAKKLIFSHRNKK